VPLTTSLYRHAETCPDGIAFIDNGNVWTYRRLATEVTRLASKLLDRGVSSDDAVVLSSSRLPELAISYYACSDIGAVVCSSAAGLIFPRCECILQRKCYQLYMDGPELFSHIEIVRSAEASRDNLVEVHRAAYSSD
jgi:acyl-coenzyme A synthetase/AMP-(fatty) acid ligase